MRLPSPSGGVTTQEVGYFEADAKTVAGWLCYGLGGRWNLYPAKWTSASEAIAFLSPAPALSRYVCIPVGRWAAVLNNCPGGTDVGLLPSQAARELGCMAIRVACIDDSATYPARILEVYGPFGDPPLALVRSIAAAKDGGRWVFETSGKPFAFEDLSAYQSRMKSHRLTATMLEEYLRALGVPIDQEPDWAATQLVTRVSFGSALRMWIARASSARSGGWPGGALRCAQAAR